MLKSLSRLIRFLLAHSPRFFTFAVLAGLLSGACSAGLVALINAALHRERVSAEILLAFGGLLLLAPAARLLSQFLLVSTGQGLVYDLRMRLSRRILKTPLRRLENMGPHRLLVALTDDINAISLSLQALLDTTAHGALVLGSLVYMGWLSPPLLIGVLVCLALLFVSYRLPLRLGYQKFRQQREEQDTLFEHFRGLTDGTKELQMNRERRHFFMDRISGTAHSLRRLNIVAGMIFTAAIAGGWTFFFALTGLIVFILPMLIEIPTATLVGYALILLFMRGPLQLVTASTPMLGRGGVAIEKVESLGFLLGAGDDDAEAAEPAAPVSPRTVERLELRSVSYAYPSEGTEQAEDGDGFSLGPIDLAFTPGELVFLIGGNGSGKTSLAKVLLGLYEPSEGEILLDGEPISSEALDEYRQYFSTVFFDFYLFHDLPPRQNPQPWEKLNHYLERMHLDKKVTVEDDKLSTLRLSQGQRRRLALLTAYLEDRPIFLFDEWAADQDPYFKEVFYLKILPELKAAGKIIIVISHDDRFYDRADRLIKLEEGRVVYDGPPQRTLKSEPGPVLSAFSAGSV